MKTPNLNSPPRGWSATPVRVPDPHAGGTVPPDRRRADKASLWLSVGNALVALLALLLMENPDSVRLLSVISFAIFGIVVARKRNNVYFLARTLFLGLIGYYAMFIKVVAGEDASYSLFEPSTQGFGIATLMYVSTSLALFGSEVGLALGTVRRTRPLRPRNLSSDERLWRVVYWMSIPIIAVVTYQVASTLPTVLASVYGAEEHAGFLLGNLQNIGIVCLAGMYVAINKTRIRFGRVLIIVTAIVYLGWGLFLRGLRQDVVTALLALTVCWGLVRAREVGINLKNIAAIGAVVLCVEFMGTARWMLATDNVTLNDMWSQFVSAPRSDVYHFGTVSPIATTFANTLHLLDVGAVDLQWGKTFLEFIPRTPPEFIYPDRPKDYAWMFADHRLMSGGGFFELAEAYFNFGLWGTLVVPGIISFLMARAFWRARDDQTPFRYFLLFSFLGMFMRGTWYQIFAFYKSFWTAMVLFAVFAVVHVMLGKPAAERSRGSRGSEEPRDFDPSRAGTWSAGRL